MAHNAPEKKEPRHNYLKEQLEDIHEALTAERERHAITIAERDAARKEANGLANDAAIGKAVRVLAREAIRLGLLPTFHTPPTWGIQARERSAD